MSVTDHSEYIGVTKEASTPGADKERNWMPISPSGMFNLTVRSYQPVEALLNATYKLPPVVRVQ